MKVFLPMLLAALLGVDREQQFLLPETDRLLLGQLLRDHVCR
uniref:Lymphocyte antigen 6 family member E n=1 Tax=Equus asinus TaxID=9793 RepID=A0A9L0KGK4_EQUAS